MATQKQVFTEITESIDRCNHTLPGLIQFLKNGFKKLENASGGGGGGSTVEWTQIQATGTKIAEIEIDGDKTSVYAPTGATPTISVNAEDVAYSNTVSGLTADNCQEAIDELKSLIPSGASDFTFVAEHASTVAIPANAKELLIYVKFASNVSGVIHVLTSDLSVNSEYYRTGYYMSTSASGSASVGVNNTNVTLQNVYTNGADYTSSSTIRVYAK